MTFATMKAKELRSGATCQGAAGVSEDGRQRVDLGLILLATIT